MPRSSCLAALALLALVACTTAEATPVTAPGGGAPPAVGAPHPAMAIAERLDRSDADAVPDLVGLQPGDAAAALAAVGSRPIVVALSESEEISAQYPAPGAPVPADGDVVVWLGTPPVPPPPAAPAPAPAQVAAAVAPAPAPAPAPAKPPAATTPDPAPVPPPGAPAPPGSATPAASPAPAPAADSPPPVRSNIRTMAAAEPGTVLEGRASWYGPGFAGNTTACGGTFDPESLTLATRELRCGTKVRVTGPGGTSVEATVTDWGPAEWTNRRFDLSAATFRAVSHLGAGVIDVRIEVLAP